MLMIRLQRFGRKNDPNFRIVLTDKRNAPKSGKFLEILGFYNPKTKAKKIDGERVKYWISRGAKASATAHNLLLKEKVISGKAINIVPKPKIVPVGKEDNNSSPQPPPLTVRGGGEERDDNLSTGGGVIVEPAENIPLDNQQK